MAKSLQSPCPHCGTDAASFRLIHHYRHPQIGNVRLLLECDICHEPIVAAYPGGAVEEWAKGNHTVFPQGMTPIWVWPKPAKIEAPKSVPTNIVKLYEQAMSAHNRKHYDAAGPLFRRIMEVSVKAIHPEGQGSLYDRINGLPDDKGVTPAMKQWAHAVRLIGRDATHDEELVAPEEAEDMRSFVELFLVYAFDLPARIGARTRPAN